MTIDKLDTIKHLEKLLDMAHREEIVMMSMRVQDANPGIVHIDHIENSQLRHKGFRGSNIKIEYDIVKPFTPRPAHPAPREAIHVPDMSFTERFGCIHGVNTNG